LKTNNFDCLKIKTEILSELDSLSTKKSIPDNDTKNLMNVWQVN